MRRAARWLLVALLACGTWPPGAAAQKLQACARGGLEACFELLNRPRLDPGRRAAIELHLAEIQTLSEACTRGTNAACATLAERYPDLPPGALGPPPR